MNVGDPMSAPSTKYPPHLLVWPGVTAWRIRGDLWLDRKFKDGMDLWARQWSGTLGAVMDVEELPEVPPFGAYRWQGEAENFSLTLIEPGQTMSTGHLAGARVLLANADDPRKLNAAELCRSAGCRCILMIEYTLATRLDMNRYAEVSRFQKLKTSIWLLLNEIRVRRAIRRADSVQANGMPAYRAYAARKANGLLYFDTRLDAGAVIPIQSLADKLGALRTNRPLRLAFSGRLIAGKGADELLPLARKLKDRGLAFHLDVYGSGQLATAMAQGIAAHGLEPVMTLHGPVDFETELIPVFQREIDLFVCCHRQGDPSCTYAETLGCGIPIVGYSNESLQALVRNYDVGWTVPMNDLDRLADQIMLLANQRDEIAAKAYKSREFGLANSFESTFRARLEHCALVAA